MSLREFWDRQAEPWGRFARTPGHDAYHEGFNFPAFLELLPAAGRRTLDLGCGEGRVGAELARGGHTVVGVDASPAMVEMARERHEALVADAGDLPFEDDSFDLVVAYMSVMNLDDPEAGIREAARVLEPGGRLCIAVVHPVAALVGIEGDEFAITGSYFEPADKLWESDRDGIQMTFCDRSLQLERLSRAHEEAGLLIQAIREPRPSEEFVRANPMAERRRRVPLFLHLRAVKP
ncbi:MAG: class I SAM-dependent methyltransferase [Actinobacteria bacterium]|nr:class I SAM-dependent methyltransferase [Actinomycetota bacterium]